MRNPLLDFSGEILTFHIRNSVGFEVLETKLRKVGVFCVHVAEYDDRGRMKSSDRNISLEEGAGEFLHSAYRIDGKQVYDCSDYPAIRERIAPSPKSRLE